MDTISKKARSDLMARVKSTKNKSTEIRLAKALRRSGLNGWRRHQKIVGRPDFLFKSAKIAIFVDGCFWHGCQTCGRIPKENRDFWTKKISTNKARDIVVNKALRKLGYKVIRIWECRLRRDENQAISIIKRFLHE